MTRDAWLRTHAWLLPMAQVHDRVDAALAALAVPQPAMPPWDDHRDDHEQGVPLLHGDQALLELEPAGQLLRSLIDALATAPGDATAKAAADPADALTTDARALRAQLQDQPRAAEQLVQWLQGDDAWTPCAPGTLRFLGWTALTRWLAPVLAGFARWRDEDRWLRSYCPTCGSAPAMAKLVGAEHERKRMLVCGCCGCHWRYQRTACPFCEHDAQRIGIVGVDGENGLRLDYCQSCKGYLKTWHGTGEDSVMLADWTSLHLDVLAHDRGLLRMAASLYDVEPLLQAAAPPSAAPPR